MSVKEFAPQSPATVSRRRPLRNNVGAAVLMVLLSLPLPRWLVPGESVSAQAWRELAFWGLLLVLVAYILLFERRPLSSIGLKRPNWKTLVFGALGAMVMVGGMAFIYMVIYPALGLSASEPGTAAVAALPFWLRVLIVVRAAVFEEMYFRGFAIERLTDILGTRRGSAAITLVAFTAEHLSYWGRAHLMIAGFGGAVLTGLYLWRRDLGANIVAHLLTDGIGFLLG